MSSMNGSCTGNGTYSIASVPSWTIWRPSKSAVCTNAPRAQSVRQRKESRAVRADQVPVYWTVIPFASVNVAQTVVSSAYSLHGGLLVVADTVITSES